MTVEVVCALVLHKGTILGTRRRSSSARGGQWEFPGGKVNVNELPEDAILREMDEELGISVTVIRRLPSLVHHYPETSIRLIPYICKWKTGTIKLNDHDQYAWISREKLFEYDWSEADKNLILLLQQSTDLFHGPIA
jgi:8-oxo-dGTP diphosphatase